MTERDRAIVFTARETAELCDVAREEVPLQPDEMAGPTVCTLVSAGTELNWAYQGASFPSYPGYAAVFRVAEAGTESGAAVGDLRFCMGPHCSWQRARRSEAVAVPPCVDPRDAVFARLACVSMSTLTTTTARPPQNVLVTGLGPVGHIGAQVFRACGYRVYAWDVSEHARSVAEADGACGSVLRQPPLESPGLPGSIALALECSGHEVAVLDACQCVQPRGEVVLVGVPWRQHANLSAHELLDAVFHRYAVVRSGWEWEVPQQPTEFRTNSMYGNIAVAMEWLGDGRLRVGGLRQAMAPGDAQRAYQDLLHRRTMRLAVVFEWQNG